MPKVDAARQRRSARPGVKECTIVANIVKALKARGCWVMKSHGGPLQRAGVPDLIVIYRGRAVMIEVKRPGEQATPLQEHTINQVRAAGGIAGVATSVDEALGLLEDVI